MPQLLIRRVDEGLVRKLKRRARDSGVSMEEQLRRILRESLSEQPRTSLKSYLLSIPQVGEDADFARIPQPKREVEL